MRITPRQDENSGITHLLLSSIIPVLQTLCESVDFSLQFDTRSFALLHSSLQLGQLLRMESLKVIRTGGGLGLGSGIFRFGGKNLLL